MDKAQSFVILVSPQSQSSRWAEVEWRLALTEAWSDSNKMLIPVVVGGSDVPPFLRDWVPIRIDPGDEAGNGPPTCYRFFDHRVIALLPAQPIRNG